MSPPVGDSDREFIGRSVRWGIVAAGVAGVVFALLWLLKSALTPLVAAFVLAYLLDPLIDRFEARKVPRSAAVFALLGVSASVVFVAAFFIVPKLTQEISGLSERLPGYIDGALAAIGPRLESQFGVSLPGSVREALDGVRSGEISLPLEAARNFIQGALHSLTGTFASLVGLLVIPVIAFYTLVRFDEIKLWFLNLVPERYRDSVRSKTSVVNALVAGFIRGQLIVCALLGILYAIGFSVIGIDLAIAIGLVAGLLAIIPYVGSAVALATASALCLLQYGIDVHLALVVGWYALVQSLEGMVLTPRIVGRSVGIHPVAVIVGLLIGADLFGFLGLLVAVPLTAVAQVFVRDGLEAYRASLLYTGGGGSGP